MNSIFTINSRRFDGSLRRSWMCELVRRAGTLWVFKGVFDQTVEHDQLGVIHKDTISLEYYWSDRWYNVFKFYEPDGSFRNYYCNINLPPVITSSVVDYVDLDIDILVTLDGYRILDIDEYKENSLRFAYDEALKKGADDAVRELVAAIEGRQFPFESIEPLQPDDA